MSDPTLPPTVDRHLSIFVDAMREAFAADLIAIVLYGSAAEGRLRPTSDVNTVLVLTDISREALDRAAGALRTAHAAIRLEAMLLRESEIPAAAEAFAQKFDDIVRRRRVLFGADPFASLVIAREALVRRIRQVLLNLSLRTRRAYAERFDQEDRLVLLLAEIAGPLRTAAAALLELQGARPGSPRHALETVALSLDRPAWRTLPSQLSRAREDLVLEPGTAAAAVFAAIDLMDALRRQVEAAP